MVLATVLALAAAILHAAWNLLLKTAPHADRDLASWGMFLFGGTFALVLLPVVGWPGVDGLPWVALSSVVHVGYLVALVAAYRAGDFSLAYPLARGTGAIVAAGLGVALLGDHLAAPAVVAIAVVGLGLLSLVGRTSSGRSVGWAVTTALAIGTYTTIDAHGARLSSSGAAYGTLLNVTSALAVSAVFLVRGRGPALVAAARAGRRAVLGRWAVAGAASFAAYTFVLVAVRHAPVGYVTMLRESSVVLGALAGWLVLRERLGGRRLASSTVVLGGLVLLVAVTV